VIAAVVAIVAFAGSPGGHPAQAGPASPAVSSPSPAVSAASAVTPTPTQHRAVHRHHHAPVTPAGALATVRRAIVRAEGSGAIQPPAASDLLNQVNGISQAVSQGNLQDAGHKVGDLLHHLGDLTHNGQVTSRGLTVIGPSVSQLARVLPPPS
jgi:hypothetical protein